MHYTLLKKGRTGLPMATTPENIRDFQRKLYRTSKLKENYRFYSLYDKIWRLDILKTAYEQCRENQGVCGVDGMTFEEIEEEGLIKLLEKISEELKTHSYQPKPIKRVMIPKDNGKERPLGIPTIKDRIVQTACKIVMEPIFEPHLHEDSYGYRPRRCAQDAVRKIEEYLKAGYEYVYDADLSSYFDTIPQERLMAKVARRISDQAFLGLVRKLIKAPIQVSQEGGKTQIIPCLKGTPQGSVLSPLLANLYLNDFCEKMAKFTPCKIVSYADDFVILHKKAYTKEQIEWFERSIEWEGLKLNPEKTKEVEMNKMGSELNFVGFTFKRVNGFYRNTRYIKIYPSKKSQGKLKEAVRKVVKHRTSRRLEELIEKVNRITRGWGNYFRGIGYPRKVFFQMDWFIVARFYRWSRSRSQRRSKYLAQEAWEKLRKAKLEYLQPVRLRLK